MPTDDRAGLQFVAGLAWVNIFVFPAVGVILIVSGIVMIAGGNGGGWLVVIIGGLALIGIPLGLQRRRQVREARERSDDSSGS